MLKNLYFKDRFLLFLYFLVIPLSGFLYLIGLLLTIIFLIALPEIMSHMLSPRPKILLLGFGVGMLIGCFHLLWSLIRWKGGSKQDVHSSLNTPNVISDCIHEVKAELGIQREVSIRATLDEFFIYKQKKALVIAIPYVPMNLLSPSDLKEILKHELLHVKNWDTYFDRLSSQLHRMFAEGIKKMERVSLTSFNPIYWLAKFTFFLLNKAYKKRYELSDQLIDKQLGIQKENNYSNAVRKIISAEVLMLNLRFYQTEEAELMNEVFKLSFKQLKAKYIKGFKASVRKNKRFSFLKPFDEIDFGKACIHDEEVFKIYSHYEYQLLTELYSREPMPVDNEVNANPIATSEVAENPDSETTTESFDIDEKLERLNIMFQGLKLPAINLEQVEFNREIAWHFDYVNYGNYERHLVLETSITAKDYDLLLAEINRIGEGSHKAFLARKASYYYIVLDRFEAGVDEVLKYAGPKQNIFSAILAFLTGFMPINIKCGGVIPLFISKQTGELKYKVPWWNFNQRLVLSGMRNFWETSGEVMDEGEIEYTGGQTPAENNLDERGKMVDDVWRETCVWWIFIDDAINLYFYEIRLPIHSNYN